MLMCEYDDSPHDFPSLLWYSGASKNIQKNKGNPSMLVYDVPMHINM